MIRFTITIYALQNVASRISVNPWLHVKLIHIKHRMEHPLTSTEIEWLLDHRCRCMD